MEPLKPPKTIRIYQLLKQSGMNFSNSSTTVASTINNLGTGFYLTQQEAEHQRTLEVLKETSGAKNYWHVFELEVPNPIYTE